MEWREYTENVFLKIVDIWGFLICYLQIYEVLHYAHKSEKNEVICNEIKRILMEYLYKPRVEPIPLDKLEKDLQKLNPLFEKMDWNEKAQRHSERNMLAGKKIDIASTKTNTKKVRISKWLKGGVHLKIIHKKRIHSETSRRRI